MDDVNEKHNSNECVLKKLYLRFIGDLMVLFGSIGIAFTLIAGKFMRVLEFEFSKTEEIDLNTGHISTLKIGPIYDFSYFVGNEPFNIVIAFFSLLIIIGVFCHIKYKRD